MADLSQSKVGRFFDANKDREWFRLKYHPTESIKTIQHQNANLLHRLKIFNELDSQNYFDKVPLRVDYSRKIVNLMDAIIVSLESGPNELVDQLMHAENGDIDNILREQYIPSNPNSVVIEDVSIETTMSELRSLCLEANQNLIRLTSLDPYYVAGGHLRRKFVAIYKHDVDIKNVCWTLSRMKLNNRSLSVSINKRLTNRTLSVDAISNDHLCILNDIRNAIILILNFDELRGLHGKRKQILDANMNSKNDVTDAPVDMDVDVPKVNNKDPLENVAPLSPPGSDKSCNEDDEEKPFDVSSLDEEREKEKKKLFEFKFNTDLSVYRQASKLSKSKSPVIENAYIYLVDYIESSVASYQLSKVCKELQAEPLETEIESFQSDKFSVIDLAVQNLPHGLEESTRFLDRLLWYLRIVHSFDYYRKQIYRYEDDLTLRMSVIHLRSEPVNLELEERISAIKSYIQKTDKDFIEFGSTQIQKFITKDEERFNYKSYGKVITDELTSYAQRNQKPKSNETEEVYKCKHCTRVFQKLGDIGRHFVSKHRWAIDTIELETDFFNAYLFDPNKINPCSPKELIERPPNRFAIMTNLSQMGEDPDLLKQTIEAYNKMESFVREPAPRAQVESDPRNNSVVDYTDISFDEAI